SYTLEEYLELDRNSEERYKYFDGEVIAMAGGSPSHARISGNAYSALQSKLRGGRCEAFNSEMRIKVPTALPYRYPTRQTDKKTMATNRNRGNGERSKAGVRRCDSEIERAL